MVEMVFSLELKLGKRRNRLQTFQRVYAGWLVLQFLAYFQLHLSRPPTQPGPGVADFVQSFFLVFVLQHFLVLLLATPSFLAGMVTDEKAQGTLLLLLTTDLTASQIVLGKFLGGLTQVTLLTLTGLPVLCFIVGYGGLGPQLVLGVVILSGLFLATLGAVSLCLSVYCRQTRDAVLRTYLWCGLPVLAGWTFVRWVEPYAVRKWPASPWTAAGVYLGDGIRSLNPIRLLEPVWGAGNWPEFFGRVCPLAASLGGVTVVCLTLAIWRLRPVTIRQLGGGARKPRKAPWRPAVHEDDPIRWKERTAGRAWVRWLGVAVVVAASTAASYWVALQQQPLLFLVQGLVACFLLSLVVGIRASGSVSSEREGKTWETVLLTPLETWDLVIDKRAGTLQRFLPHLAAYALPALVFSTTAGAYAVAYTVATLLATLGAMHYMAANGVWCSVKSESSWRSLLVTLGSGYAYAVVIASGFLFVYGAGACVVTPLLFVLLRKMGIDDFELTAVITGTVGGTLAAIWTFVRWADGCAHSAKEWIDAQERYGRTLARSLARALKKYAERQEQLRREQQTTGAGRSRPGGSEPIGADSSPQRG
jgi:ABC-type transport system involved in multi-copper enzyme maturation permease subunit